MSRLALRLGLDRPLGLPRSRTRLGGEVLIDQFGVGGLVREIGGDRPRTGVSELQILELGLGGLERDRFDLVKHHGRLEVERLGLVDDRLRFVGHRFGRHGLGHRRDRRLSLVGPLDGPGIFLGDQHRLCGKHVARQRTVGVLGRGLDRERGSGIGAARQVRRARVLGSGERLGEALGGPARAAAPAAMRLLVLRFARGIGHRRRLRRPRRRRVAHRQAEIDARLEEVHP